MGSHTYRRLCVLAQIGAVAVSSVILMTGHSIAAAPTEKHLETSTTGEKSFVCTSVDKNMVLEVYDAVEADSHGFIAVVDASRMTILNPSLSRQSQFIAEFRSDAGVLRPSGRFLVGVVDPDSVRSGTHGRRVGGTRLGLLRTVSLEIDLSFAESADGNDGELTYSGRAVYLKRSGEALEADFDCLRISRRQSAANSP